MWRDKKVSPSQSGKPSAAGQEEVPLGILFSHSRDILWLLHCEVRDSQWLSACRFCGYRTPPPLLLLQEQGLGTSMFHFQEKCFFLRITEGEQRQKDWRWQFLFSKPLQRTPFIKTQSHQGKSGYHKKRSDSAIRVGNLDRIHFNMALLTAPLWSNHFDRGMKLLGILVLKLEKYLSEKYCIDNNLYLSFCLLLSFFLKTIVTPVLITITSLVPRISYFVLIYWKNKFHTLLMDW